ncbi:DUF1207 domain-containing protein [Candidatus Pacearchaeota archaeon]|nr:DUF1207 domain-containing protein [Candidatus Pacearchaeota archaeon]
MYSNLIAVALSSFLSEKQLSEPPLAYPLSPDLGFSLVENTRTQTTDFIAVLGRRIPFATMNLIGDTKLQLSIDAAVWSTIRQGDGDAFKVLFSDYLISFPVTVKYNHFINEFKFNHVSSHLSDGVRKERIPITYSRDYFSILVAYENEIAQRRFLREKYALSLKFKKYIELGYIHKLSPKELENRNLLHLGGELIFLDYTQQNANIYFAYDITPHPSLEKKFSYSMQLGFMTNMENPYTMRIAFVLFDGLDYRGQNLGKKLSYLGIGLFIR